MEVHFEERLDAVKDSLRRLMEHGADSANVLKARAIRVEHRAEEGARDAASAATAWIKAHPLAAVAIAFGAGYAIVKLARR